jgi:hypothetical protein
LKAKLPMCSLLAAPGADGGFGKARKPDIFNTEQGTSSPKRPSSAHSPATASPSA